MRLLPAKHRRQLLFMLGMLCFGLFSFNGCAKKTTEPDPIIFETPNLGDLTHFTDNVTISFKLYDAAGEIEKVTCRFTWTADKRMTGPCTKVPPGVYVYKLEYLDQDSNALLARANAKVDIARNNEVLIKPVLDFEQTNLGDFIERVNTAPTAKATADKKTVTVGETITLDATGSSDPNQDELTYQWEITSNPSGSTAMPLNASDATTAFVPDVVGEYKLQLTVTDFWGKSDHALLTLTANIVKPKMVTIPAGSFEMGDESSPDGTTKGEGDDDEVPVHTVAVATFEMGKYEVTFTEYDEYLAAINRAKGTTPDEEAFDWDFERGNHPVVGVSWHDIQDYLEWLNTQLGMASDDPKRYRLPTEAEWEYAARGDMMTAYNTGDCIDTSQANYNGEFNYYYNKKDGTRVRCLQTDFYRKKAEPVGSFAANTYGLHDMHGNVREWVEDCWHDHYTGAPTDGSAWVTSCTDSRRVFRSGSWYGHPTFLRSANRGRNTAGSREADYGFRLARTP